MWTINRWCCVPMVVVRLLPILPVDDFQWLSAAVPPHGRIASGQGWGQLHNINSTPTPTPEVSTPTPTPANLQNINSNSNSGSFNSNSSKSPEYQLQLQLRRFQLQLRQISRISTRTPEVSTPTPIPTPEISTPISTPTPEFQIQPQLHFKSNQSCSTKLPLPNYNVKHCMN